MRDSNTFERKLQYLRAIFDGFPLPAFVVDEEMVIHDFNSAAESFLGAEPATGLYQKTGNAFGCIKAEGYGCGHSSACESCVIRNSVRQVLCGGAVYRQLHEARLRRGVVTSRIDLLVTASLLPYKDPPRALLVLENLSGLVTKAGKKSR